MAMSQKSWHAKLGLCFVRRLRRRVSESPQFVYFSLSTERPCMFLLLSLTPQEKRTGQSVKTGNWGD